jgi:hypothetical protein
MRLTLEEWQRKHRRYAAIASRVAQSRNDRARRLCREAGLSGELLGIHPHNAMVSYRDGKPWEGVDYAKVRRCLFELRREFEAHDVVRRWDQRVRINARVVRGPGNEMFWESADADVAAACRGPRPHARRRFRLARNAQQEV